ncbi:hypothetical protein [Flavobacterium sp. KJJ]|uniref:hypothetical protein n=1 Tax=Flavobacterium sp. KJJ TaxID=1270193 RepID=UPI00049307A6|nr:hypothetical protein [Flavobacterium sp. KJJ]
MKKIGVLLILLFSIVSCSSNETETDPIGTDYYGKWIQFVEAKYNDDPNPSQVSYQFNKDNTFTKTLNYYDTTTNASGTFEVKKDGNTTVFVLTYTQQNSIISSCTGGLIESLTLDKFGHLNDNAGMCDRYGKYKKAK